MTEEYNWRESRLEKERAEADPYGSGTGARKARQQVLVIVSAGSILLALLWLFFSGD